MSRPFGTEVNEEHRLGIKKTLQFDELVAYLKVYFQLLPESRQGYNTTYTIPH